MKLRSIAQRLALPLALMTILVARPLDAHPLHTSLAEMVYDPAAKEFRISIRVFLDDLTKASDAYARSKTSTTQPAGQSKAMVETPMLAYARASFVVADRRGRSVTLISCGGNRVGDLMWICFRAAAPAGPVGLRVAHRVLFDLYTDQINIIQAAYGGKRVSLLFTAGDGLKRLE